MPNKISVETLFPAEIPANVALALEVGWPDDEADWRVVHEAAVVLGVRAEGRLIGQGALGAYESGAGTIAKMIVLPSEQRRGIGAAILDALLDEAERRSLSKLGLVATPWGKPFMRVAALSQRARWPSSSERQTSIGAPISALLLRRSDQ